jgi:putative ABC transport system permease protein
MSFMGAARIEFVNVAWQIWLLCPLVLIVVVGFTISVCCSVTVEDDLSIVLRSWFKYLPLEEYI